MSYQATTELNKGKGIEEGKSPYFHELSMSIKRKKKAKSHEASDIASEFTNGIGPKAQISKALQRNVIPKLKELEWETKEYPDTVILSIVQEVNKELEKIYGKKTPSYFQKKEQGAYIVAKSTLNDVQESVAKIIITLLSEKEGALTNEKIFSTLKDVDGISEQIDAAIKNLHETIQDIHIQKETAQRNSKKPSDQFLDQAPGTRGELSKKDLEEIFAKSGEIKKGREAA